MEYDIPRPIREMFKNSTKQTSIERVLDETTPFYLVEKVEYTETDGVLLHKKDCLYPTRGFVYPEAIIAADTVKQTIVGTYNVFRHWQIIGFIFLVLISSKKQKLKILNSYFDSIIKIGDRLFTPHLIEPKYLSPFSKEFYKLLNGFLKRLGVIRHEQASEFITNIIEYDDAYRYRLIDFFSSRRNDIYLKNDFYTEIRKMLKLAEKREFSNLYLKKRTKFIRKLFTFVFTSSNIRKSFDKSIADINLEKLSYDKIEWYNVLIRGDYNFGGKTHEERFQEFCQVHNNELPQQYLMKRI